MSTLSQNIVQAINDFDAIKSAIIEKGVEVPDRTPTSEYANKVLQIEGGGTHPEGTISITENGFWDVTDYAQAAVLVDSTNDYDAFIAGSLPEVTTNLSIIPDFAFSGKSGLHVVNAPNATYIGKYAFSSSAGAASSSSSGSISGDGGDEEPVGFTNKYLTTVNMPNVTTIDTAAFKGDESLELSELPNTLAVIMDNAFSGCTNMHISDLPSNILYIGDQALNTGNTFRLRSFPPYVETIQENGDINYSEMNWSSLPASIKTVYLYSHYRQPIDEYIRSNYTHQEQHTGTYYTILDVDRLPAQWFSTDFKNYNCNSIFNAFNLHSTIQLPETITYLRPYCFSGLTFYSDLDPLALELPDSIQDIGEGAFQNCQSLEQLKFPNALQILASNMCGNCTRLTSVTLPTTLQKIENNAFNSCQNLSSITLPQSLTRIENGAFISCNNLPFVEFPLNLAYIGDSAFAYATSNAQGTLIIPDSVTYLGNSAFRGAFPSVERLVIGSGLTTIEIYAFYQIGNSSNYLEIVLGENVQTIRSEAFRFSQAKRVYIPSSVELIESFAFDGCNDIEIYYEGTEEQWAAITRETHELDSRPIYFNSSPDDIDQTSTK